MNALSASQLLAVWEGGADQFPAQRGLTILAAACPDETPAALAAISVGQRNDRLLTLREWAFGGQFAGVTDCPACQERMEMNYTVADLRAALGPAQAEPPDGFPLGESGYQVRYRLPNTLDLLAAASNEGASADASRARRVLLARCLLSVERGGETVVGGELPEALAVQVAAGMAQADPLADVRIDLCCPACEHQWQAPFDILAYLWSEIDSWALRTLQEIHRLAAAYGWSETEILNLSPRRRQTYLAMVLS